MKPKPIEKWLRRIAKAIVGLCLLILLAVLVYGAATGSTYSDTILLMVLFFGACVAAAVWLAAELRRNTAKSKKPAAAPADTVVGETKSAAQPAPEATAQPQPAEPVLEPLPAHVGQCPWGTYPPLSEAVESGPVGAGSRHQFMSQGEINTLHEATEQVQYHFFSDGTLVLIGKGATKSVDPGGHDGRNSYQPERPPWSDTVCQNTVRVLVTEGITALGSGLLDSLIKLEELNLADSVESVGFNNRCHLHILRAGKQFRSFSGFTAPLTELVLPDHTVHFQYHNGGSLAGVTSKDPAIQAKLDEHLQREYAETMEQLFRQYPGIAKKMASIARYHSQTAASALVSLDWNSKYKKSRLVGGNDLYELHGLPKNKQQKAITKITLKHQYGLHEFVMVAAMLHAVILTAPGELRCSIDHIRWNDELSCWWHSVNPQVKLVITQKNGDEIIVPADKAQKPVSNTSRQDADLVRPIPHRDSYPLDIINGARSYFSQKELDKFKEDTYQYSMDINRGGLDPEQAAANRGFVLIGMSPCPIAMVPRMNELYEKSPFRRAHRPFEIAGPNRDSFYEAESRYFLPLADAHLADKLDWGQSEYYAVDTRTWEPWYIVTQYDGAVVAHTWFDVKEKLTWEEVERLASPKAKAILGHDPKTPWQDCSYRRVSSADGITVSWRGTPQLWYEATLHQTETGATLHQTTNFRSGKPTSTEKTLSADDCATLEAFTKTLRGMYITADFIIELLWNGLRHTPHKAAKQPKKPVRKTLAEEVRNVPRHHIYGHDSGHGWQIRVGLVPNSRTAFVEVTDDGYPNPGASGGFFRTLPHRLVKDGCVKVGDVLAFVAENTPCEVNVDDPDKVIRL